MTIRATSLFPITTPATPAPAAPAAGGFGEAIDATLAIAAPDAQPSVSTWAGGSAVAQTAAPGLLAWAEVVPETATAESQMAGAAASEATLTGSEADTVGAATPCVPVPADPATSGHDFTFSTDAATTSAANDDPHTSPVVSARQPSRSAAAAKSSAVPTGDTRHDPLQPHGLSLAVGEPPVAPRRPALAADPDAARSVATRATVSEDAPDPADQPPPVAVPVPVPAQSVTTVPLDQPGAAAASDSALPSQAAGPSDRATGALGSARTPATSGEDFAKQLDAPASPAPGAFHAAAATPATQPGSPSGAMPALPTIAAPTGAPTPTAAAAPQAPTHHATVAAQPGRIGREMGVAIAHRIGAGGTELTVRLNPAEMGRVDVTMSFDDRGTLRATVAAERAAALDLLRGDSAALGRALSDAGVRADVDSFRFDSRAGSGEGNGGQPWQRSGSQPGGGIARRYPADTTVVADLPLSRTLRTAGRVDLTA